MNNVSKPGLWGGTVSSYELKINVTQEMNGIVYTCQSNNEALQRSVHEAVTLNVLCTYSSIYSIQKFIHRIAIFLFYLIFFCFESIDPPKFTQPSYKAVGTEGKPLALDLLKAEANPMPISFTWMKDGSPIADNDNGNDRIITDGIILNITKLMRSDAGIYTCKAVNSQGSATTNITVTVECKFLQVKSAFAIMIYSIRIDFFSISDGTTIKSVSENMIVNPGDDATLACSVEGSPLNEDHVRWERLGYDMSDKTKVTFVNGTSYLHVKKARREDVGNFRCIADNRIANPTSQDVLLIVKCKLSNP